MDILPVAPARRLRSAPRLGAPARPPAPGSAPGRGPSRQPPTMALFMLEVPMPTTSPETASPIYPFRLGVLVWDQFNPRT